MSVIFRIAPAATGRGRSGSNTANDGNWLKMNVKVPTLIRNENLLRETLENMGVKKFSKGIGASSMAVEIDHFVLELSPNKDKNYMASFYGEISETEAKEFVSELEEEYGNLLQNHVYETLKKKAEANGMTLLNETVQNNQTIVLTYNLK